MQNTSDSFLAKVAAQVLSDHNGNMHHACVVLPNRRAGIFLKRHLSSKLDSPAFAPSVFSVEDFVFELSGLNQADPLMLLWELYAAWSKKDGGENQTFEEFIKWGKVLLQDFEEADMYLVNTSSLFSYLSEAKAIELWNPGKASLTPGQQRYLDFYRSLGDLHKTYTSSLFGLNLAYKGMAFRYLAENLLEKRDKLRWKHIYFAGFNAFTPCEHAIIHALEKLCTLTRLFDADSYYLADNKQEAGKYLRDVYRESDPAAFRWVGNELTGSVKNIRIIGVPHNTGQTMVAGSLLSDVPPGEESETAVVLNDESLLIPLLNALPDNIGQFNITMGYPFSLTPAFSLIDTLLNLQIHAYSGAQHHDRDSAAHKGLRIYFRNVATLLKHPYVAGLFNTESNDADLVRDLLNQGKVFFTKEHIIDHFSGSGGLLQFLAPALDEWRSTTMAVDRLIDLTKMLAAKSSPVDDHGSGKLDNEYLYQLMLILNRLKILVEKADAGLSMPGLQQLIRNVAASTQLPFTGEPLRGVQIMGMLETRTLDFKNVIMLSVNEGVLPSGKKGNSFIPFDIRRESGLPVYSDRDTVFAYHFYRLLQRCENLYLIYNTTPDDLGGGEKSRFILQLEHELTKLNANISWSESFYTPVVSFDAQTDGISIEKNAEIIARLREMAAYGLSPSALSTYVVCPLQFCFSYVLRIAEEDVTEESMDASTFGTGIHEALRELFEPYVNRELSSEILKNIEKNAGRVLRENFLKAYNNNDLDHGKNLLMLEVAGSFLNRFIRLELEELETLRKNGASRVIRSVEYELARKIPVMLHIAFDGNPEFPIRLRGKADRIDGSLNQTRVIDYKTGFVKPAELKITDWEQALTDPGKQKALQLLIYSYLYSKEFNAPLPESGIISFRNLNQGFLNVSFPGPAGEALDQTEVILRRLLQGIFDVSTPFTQTDDAKNCRHCSFAGVCAR